MQMDELKKKILMSFSEGEFYGYEVGRVLKPKIDHSRLYRILGEMCREGLIYGRWEKSQLGPQRKIYRISPKGKKELQTILSSSIDIVHRFYQKYMESHPQETNIFYMYSDLVFDKLRPQSRVGYITRRGSPMHEGILSNIKKRAPETELYLIKPESTNITFIKTIPGLFNLNGTLDNIPLKACFFDLLIAADLPAKDNIREALKEMHRVLKHDGKLEILIPSIMVEQTNGPLTLGDYIEKHEHEVVQGFVRINGDFLQKLLKKYFSQVDKRKILYMTAFVASKTPAL